MPYPTHLGRYLIHDLLPRLGVTRYALARAIGCSPGAIDKRLLRQATSVSRDAMARGLRQLGTLPADLEHALDLDAIDRGLLTVPSTATPEAVKAARLALSGAA